MSRSRHILRFAARTAPLLLTVTALTAVGPAHAADTTPGAIAAGVLTDNGRPVPGAVVTVQVWPNDDVLATLNAGDVVPMLVLPAERTGPDGRYAVTGELPDSHRDADGRAHVQLLAGDQARQIRWSYTALPAADPTSAWTAAAGDDTLGSTALDTRLDLGLGTAWEGSHDPARFVGDNTRRYGEDRRNEVAYVGVEDRSAELNRLAAVTRASQYAPDGALVAIGGGDPRGGQGDFTTMEECTLHYTGPVPDRPERFVTVYAWSHGQGKVIQSYGNEHTLGVGYKSLSGYWSAKGSNTKTFSASASQGGLVDVKVFNRVNYRDYQNICGGAWRQPYSYADLISGWSSVSHRNFGGYCSIKSPGYTFTTSSARNVTYGGGVDIGPINVMAQAGYDNGVDLQFNIDWKSWLCGNNSDGLLASSQLSASNYY